ncbi:IS110 family transposase [Micromonospora chersina]|uniref:IS110 family transposase n=1 Tax=Micromonospora chersina TaxID=47854 RepID=UPI00371C2B63
MAGKVVIGVDPHKASWTAAAVDSSQRVLAVVRVEVNRDGYRQLRRFARRFPHAVWAIEGAGGLGAPLVTRLAADDIRAVDVPAKLAARVRLLSTGHNRKTDQADAVSVAVAALTAQGLRSVETDQSTAALRALTEHREDLVRTRTQTVNRLHVLLAQLLPAGAAANLTADSAATLLRTVRPRELLARTQRQIAVDLVAEIRRLDRRISAAGGAITAAVAAAGSTLTRLYGVGDIVAAIVLARTGSVSRFASSAHFASFAGVAPIEVSSGDVVRHRLSRAGDRQLNRALHVIAITQIRGDTAGRAYYQRNRQTGKGHREALRCLKRRLADVVYRTLLHDANTSFGTPS